MIDRVVVGGEVAVPAVRAALEFGARGYLFGAPASRGPVPDAPGAVRLDIAEVMIVALVADGMTDAEIAATTMLAEADVATRIAEVRTRAGARNRAHLVLLVLRSGMIS